MQNSIKHHKYSWLFGLFPIFSPFHVQFRWKVEGWTVLRSMLQSPNTETPNVGGASPGSLYSVNYFHFWLQGLETSPLQPTTAKYMECFCEEVLLKPTFSLSLVPRFMLHLLDQTSATEARPPASTPPTVYFTVYCTQDVSVVMLGLQTQQALPRHRGSQGGKTLKKTK